MSYPIVGTPVAAGAARTLLTGLPATAAVGVPAASGTQSLPVAATPAGLIASALIGQAFAGGGAIIVPGGVQGIGLVGGFLTSIALTDWIR